MLLAVEQGDSPPPSSAAGSSGGQPDRGPRAARVLVVDDEENLRHLLQILLKKEGYEPVGVGSVDAALAELDRDRFDILITDLRMPGRSGLELVDEVRARNLVTTVVVMTAYGSREVAIEAMKRGAYDYLSKPFEADELMLLLRKAEERERLHRENRFLRQRLGATRKDEDGLGGMVAQSAAMKDLFRTVRKIADFKTTVLIQGESGTGKELVARAIHDESVRAHRPFVAINCGAIPAQLLESELFGHVRGAFTDAVRDRAGLFEQADRGTLFLDEIADMPLELQVKLLRVLQEGEVRRLGAARSTPIDVRVVAATARPLQAEVQAGRFREDLFYRLNVVSLHLPSLRARPSDIPVLVDHFINRLNQRLGLAIEGVTPEAMGLLMEGTWPGNVRELENRIERAMILADQGFLGLAEVTPRPAFAGASADSTDDLSIKATVRRAEEESIRRALARTGGNRTRAAEVLGISYRALLYKIKDYGLARPDEATDASTPPSGTARPTGGRGGTN